MTTTTGAILVLETIENGGYLSLVANDGDIYATGSSSHEMLGTGKVSSGIEVGLLNALWPPAIIAG